MVNSLIFLFTFDILTKLRGGIITSWDVDFNSNIGGWNDNLLWLFEEENMGLQTRFSSLVIPYSNLFFNYDNRFDISYSR